MRSTLALAGLLMLTGCGSTGPDFTEAADAPAAMLSAEFAAIGAMSSPLTEAGFGASRVRVERRGKNEVLFTIPSSENKAGSTFLMQFAPGDKPLHSTVSVTIEVPAVSMGFYKVLSEEKVEKYFREYTRKLIGAVSSRSSTSDAAHEFVTMFDALALATNPALRIKVQTESQAIDLGEGDSGDGGAEPSDEEINRSLLNNPDADGEDQQLGTEPEGVEPQPREPEGTDPNPE